MKKISLLVLCIVFLSPFALAEELIFEDDPDEPLKTALSSDVKREGYERLFEDNEKELEGLRSVLIPLQDDISSLDLQITSADLQRKRMMALEKVLQRKRDQLQGVSEKWKVQEQLLTLELKDLTKKFQELLSLFFKVKRHLVTQEGKVNLIQLLLAPDPKDLLLKDFFLQRIGSQLGTITTQVFSRKAELQELQKKSAVLTKQLDGLRDRVRLSAAALFDSSEFHRRLLSEKREEQEFFQKALAEAKSEQVAIQKRITLLASGISRYEYREFGTEGVIFPVEPLLGISARFRDPDYQARFGIPHDGIDLPTDQLTPVRAALSGKVVKVQDGGIHGYSYLQLAHRDGLSTVYGHIYESKVSEGDIVEQGQVVALSGGALGTKGAGKLTTGPHLHFEILQDGVRQDPLKWLSK